MADGTDPAWGDRDAGRSRLLTALLWVLLVAVLVTSASLVYDRATHHTPDAPELPTIGVHGATGFGTGVAAVNVARRAALDFFGLDYRHPTAGGDALKGYATESFLSQYQRQVAPLRGRIVRSKLVLHPVLVPMGTATEYLTDTQAQVLVSIDLTTSAPGMTPRVTQYHTRVTLERPEQRWLVTGIDQVPAP